MTPTTYRHHLPQSASRPFIADGGLETTLIFHEGRELPLFGAFVLLDDEEGLTTLRLYYESYAAMARRHRTGLILDTPTWRANSDWATKLGYDRAALARINRDAVALVAAVRDAWAAPEVPMVLSGAIGPRGDGYVAGARMSAAEAKQYHGEQIAAFEAAGADMTTAFTLNYIDEAVGIAQAGRDIGLPVVISFTVETDGRLPSGESVAAAIARTDDLSGGYPAYYMLNCAHPDHFDGTLAQGGDWLQRLGGIRANASRKSHAELDESIELDIGDPHELALSYRLLRDRLPNLKVIGGCCGTDQRHVEAMCQAVFAGEGSDSERKAEHAALTY